MGHHLHYYFEAYFSFIITYSISNEGKDRIARLNLKYAKILQNIVLS